MFLDPIYMAIQRPVQVNFFATRNLITSTLGIIKLTLKSLTTKIKSEVISRCTTQVNKL